MPQKPETPPPSDALRALVRAGLAFIEAAPWRYLTDEDLFAVENPETGEMAYCLVMGAAGIDYGLMACLGLPGLAGLALMLNDGLDGDELLLTQNSLNFSMADRDQLEASDRAALVGLGMKFRGRGAWPLFLRHEPIYLPRRPNDGEAAFLTVCLEQAQAIMDASEEMEKARERGEIVVRRRNPSGGWDSKFEAPPEVTLTVGCDTALLERTKRACKKSSHTWESQVVALTQIRAAPGERGYWARVVLCVDQQSGMITMSDPLEPDDRVEDGLLTAMKRSGSVPREMRVSSLLLRQHFEPVASALGIRLAYTERLQALPNVKRALPADFG